MELWHRKYDTRVGGRVFTTANTRVRGTQSSDRPEYVKDDKCNSSYKNVKRTRLPLKQNPPLWRIKKSPVGDRVTPTCSRGAQTIMYRGAGVGVVASLPRAFELRLRVHFLIMQSSTSLASVYRSSIIYMHRSRRSIHATVHAQILFMARSSGEGA